MPRFRCPHCRKIRKVRRFVPEGICYVCYRKSLPKWVLHRMPDGSTRRVNTSWALQRRGQSNGGKQGKGHRWNSETAREAILKYWRTKGRMNHHVMLRLGRPRKYRKAVPRQPIRDHYSMQPSVSGYWYDHSCGQWFYQHGMERTPVQERTALRNMGYLPRNKPRKFIPNNVDQLDGKDVAWKPKHVDAGKLITAYRTKVAKS